MKKQSTTNVVVDNKKGESKMKTTKETLQQILNLEKISNEMNDIISRTITLSNCKDTEYIELIKKIEAKNRENKQYTKFNALCQIILAYDKVREHKEYNSKKFIVKCESLIEANQLVNDIFFSGFAGAVYLKAESEYDKDSKTFENTINVLFTLRYYSYGTKFEILNNAGVQLIKPAQEEEQEVRDLQQSEIELAESLLASAGLPTSLLVKK